MTTGHRKHESLHQNHQNTHHHGHEHDHHNHHQGHHKNLHQGPGMESKKLILVTFFPREITFIVEAVSLPVTD